LTAETKSPSFLDGSWWRRRESNACIETAPDPGKDAGSAIVAGHHASESAPAVQAQREPVQVQPSESHDLSDADLERAIVDAVTMGLGDVARTLAGRLEERRRAKGGNMVDLEAERARRRR
jgi:hypothetical protein